MLRHRLTDEQWKFIADLLPPRKRMGRPRSDARDMIVGPENAAPPGMSAWWVTNAPFSLAHLSASTDPRILADIARRLRNEMPFTTTPATPLPDKQRTND